MYGIRSNKYTSYMTINQNTNPSKSRQGSKTNLQTSNRLSRGNSRDKRIGSRNSKRVEPSGTGFYLSSDIVSNSSTEDALIRQNNDSDLQFNKTIQSDDSSLDRDENDNDTLKRRASS